MHTYRSKAHAHECACIALCLRTHTAPVVAPSRVCCPPPLQSPHALSLQSLRVILRANGGQSDAGNDQLQS